MAMKKAMKAPPPMKALKAMKAMKKASKKEYGILGCWPGYTIVAVKEFRHIFLKDGSVFAHGRGCKWHKWNPKQHCWKTAKGNWR